VHLCWRFLAQDEARILRFFPAETPIFRRLALRAAIRGVLPLCVENVASEAGGQGG
jgi:hypothetical protein